MRFRLRRPLRRQLRDDVLKHDAGDLPDRGWSLFTPFTGIGGRRPFR
jgi:hypothetical protein